MSRSFGLHYRLTWHGILTKKAHKTGLYSKIFKVIALFWNPNNDSIMNSNISASNLKIYQAIATK